MLKFVQGFNCFIHCSLGWWAYFTSIWLMASRFNSVIWQKNALACFYFFKPTIKIQRCAATVPLHWKFCKCYFKNFYQTLTSLIQDIICDRLETASVPFQIVLMQTVVPLAIILWHWHISYPPFQVCRALNWHLPCPTWILWLYNVWTPYENRTNFHYSPWKLNDWTSSCQHTKTFFREIHF